MRRKLWKNFGLNKKGEGNRGGASLSTVDNLALFLCLIKSGYLESHARGSVGWSYYRRRASIPSAALPSSEVAKRKIHLSSLVGFIIWASIPSATITVTSASFSLGASMYPCTNVIPTSTLALYVSFPFGLLFSFL